MRRQADTVLCNLIENLTLASKMFSSSINPLMYQQKLDFGGVGKIHIIPLDPNKGTHAMEICGATHQLAWSLSTQWSPSVVPNP
jgi:hypothetical protein